MNVVHCDPPADWPCVHVFLHVVWSPSLSVCLPNSVYAWWMPAGAYWPAQPCQSRLSACESFLSALLALCRLSAHD